MDPIYPVSALQKRQGDVKRAAQDHIVRITENGTGAYVFCSETMFEQRMAEVAEQAAYEERLAMGIEPTTRRNALSAESMLHAPN